MRQIKIMEHISIDGVIQHSVDDNNFPYPDWSAPYRTPEGRDLVLAIWGEKFDVLLGRRTYDLWSTFWPKAPISPMAERLNAATKFVVTHRPDSLAWGPFRALSQNIVEDIRSIKAQEGPDLIVSGSTAVTTPLLEHGLADELVLFVDPVLLGTGRRLFADGTPARSFALTRSHSTPTGIVLNIYKPTGSLKNHS